MLSTGQVEAMIERGFSEADAMVTDMTGTGDHFDAVVVSSDFEGRSLIQQHQLVYAALGDAMKGPVHALKLTTMTPAHWQARQNQE